MILAQYYTVRMDGGEIQWAVVGGERERGRVSYMQCEQKLLVQKGFPDFLWPPPKSLVPCYGG